MASRYVIRRRRPLRMVAVTFTLFAAVFVVAFAYFRKGVDELAKVTRFKSIIVTRDGEGRDFHDSKKAVAIIAGDSVDFVEGNGVIKTTGGDEFEFFPAGAPLTLRGEKGVLRWKTDAGALNGAFTSGDTHLMFGPLAIRPEADSSIRVNVPPGRNEIRLRSKLKGCQAEVAGAFGVTLSNNVSPSKGSFLEVIIDMEITGYRIKAVIEGDDQPVRIKGLKGGTDLAMFSGSEAFIQDGVVVSAKGKYEAGGPIKWEEPAVEPGQGAKEAPGEEPPAPENTEPPSPVEETAEKPDVETPDEETGEEPVDPEPMPPGDGSGEGDEGSPPETGPEPTPALEPAEPGGEPDPPVPEDPPAPGLTPEVEKPVAGETSPEVAPEEKPAPEIAAEPVDPPDESPDIQPYSPPETGNRGAGGEEASKTAPVAWVLRGAVSVLREGKEFQIPKGRNELKKGDVIRVGPRAKVRVEIPSGISYTLGENSEFRID